MTAPAPGGRFEGLADPEALPRVTAVSRPFFAAAARGELAFQRCDCGHAFLYPRSLCPSCHSERLSWEMSSGRGEVVTFAPVHRPPWNQVGRPLPYVVVLVSLEEGPQLMSTLERVKPQEVRVGQAVRAAFEPLDDGIGLVRFVLDEERRPGRPS